MNEWERIAALRDIFQADPCPSEGHVSLGIGDDAAALAVDGTLVVSVDAMVEHVHFERAWLSMEDLGYKAAMAALSDLAAMGARPVGSLGSLALPANVSDADLEALARGQQAAMVEVGARVIGGNLARAAELSIHTTVLGATDAPLRRDGARPGDGVFVAGELGLAAAGLRALRDRRDGPEAWVNAWRRPRARIAEGLRAAEVASAAIDVSDGLAADVGHLATASGLAVVLDRGALFEPSLELALYGGEDYALVITAAAPVPGFRRIGSCEAGTGVWLAHDGHREPLEARGWDHFAARDPDAP